MGSYSFAADTALCDQAYALRHLPPHAELLKPPSELAQHLLADLLLQPEELNPLLWLHGERAAVCAVLALEATVKLALEIHGIGRPRAFKNEDERLPRLFGSLFAAGQHPTFQEGPPQAPLLDELGSTLAWLRESARLPYAASPNFSAGRLSLYCLLADLLRLSPEVEPLAWLQSERPGECAWLALRELIRACQPRASTLLASAATGPTLVPHTTVRSSRGLRVAVEEVRVREKCCVATFQIRFPAHIAPKETLPRWTGFTRVSDDQGYSYLVQAGGYEGSSGLWRAREQLTLIAYPAPLGVRTLTWAAQPAVLTCHMVLPDVSELVPTMGPNMGDLSWTVPLPQ